MEIWSGVECFVWCVCLLEYDFLTLYCSLMLGVRLSVRVCKNWLHGDRDFSSVGTGALENGLSLPSEALLHVSCLCMDHGSNIIRKPLRVDMGKSRYLLLSSEGFGFGSSPLFNLCLFDM